MTTNTSTQTFTVGQAVSVLNSYGFVIHAATVVRVSGSAVLVSLSDGPHAGTWHRYPLTQVRTTTEG